MKDGGSFAHPECYWRKRAEALEERVEELEGELADARSRIE